MSNNPILNFGVLQAGSIQYRGIDKDGNVTNDPNKAVKAEIFVKLPGKPEKVIYTMYSTMHQSYTKSYF